MCIADSQIIKLRWVEGIRGAYPDFNTKHRCGDYEALLDWDDSRSPHRRQREWG